MQLKPRALATLAAAAIVTAGAVLMASQPQYPSTAGPLEQKAAAVKPVTPAAPVTAAVEEPDATGQEPAAVPAPLRPGAPPALHTGVIALNDGGIMIVDARTFLTYGPFLDGELGTSGGGLFDVVLTKTGTKAFVTNFGDSRVNVINLQRPGNPTFIGAVTLDFFAEDMALSPNQKFLLVTDGGFSPKVAVIKVATRAVVGTFDLTPFSVYAQSIDVAKDNKTVVASDYWNGALLVLTMNPLTGALGYVGSTDIMPMRPVNTAISPNGKTVVACSAAVDGNPAPGDPVIDMGAVFRVNAPGNVEFMGNVTPPDPTVMATQSAVFSRNGTKLYWLATKEDYDPVTGLYPHVVYVYDVVAPGVLSYTGTEIPLADGGGGSALFGVDVMSIDPKNEFLYVSNQTLSGGQNKVAVISLKTNRQVLALVPGPVGEGRIPTGIAFK